MNLNSPLLTSAFNGGTTSALSRIPSPFQAFPGGNIGYANRTSGFGNALEDAVKYATDKFTDIVGDVAEASINLGKRWLDSKLSKVQREALESSGYIFFELVEIEKDGKRVTGVRAKKPTGTFVVVLDDGTEVPWTSETQKTATKVDPKTGLSTGAVVGISVAAVAVIALLLFLPRGRR